MTTTCQRIGYASDSFRVEGYSRNETMTPNSLPNCPFVTSGKIVDRQFFVGRRNEIDSIIRHIQSDQPQSVNIVGDRQIGKSSLLYHIVQTYADRVNQTDRVVAVYLSLQSASCRDVASFYQTLATELLQLSTVQTRPNLADPLRVQPFDEMAFARAVATWKAAGVMMVVCLDDFDELLDRGDRFNNNFYDHLRSILQDRGLMFVLASRQQLLRYSQQKKLTSDFFNVFDTHKLQEFTDAEAQDLVQKPDAANDPALGEERQALALNWGGRHPRLLQIAALCLWEARQQDRKDAWARQQFEARSQGVPRKLQPMKQLVWAVMRLGTWAQSIGNTTDDLGNFFKGAFILVLIGCVVTGAANWQQIQDWFQGTKQETQENFK
jgi:uncharacterized protein